MRKFPTAVRSCRSFGTLIPPESEVVGLRASFQRMRSLRETKLAQEPVPEPAKQTPQDQSTQLPQAEFLKLIRKPPEFFGQVVEGVKLDLRQLSAVEGDPQLQKLLTSKEREHLRETIYMNMAFSKPVASNFLQSALGLPKMGAAIYSHMFSGVVNYVLRKKGLDPTTVSSDDLGNMVRLGTYYRSPLLIEELKRLGYDADEVNKVIARGFYMQYWSGDHANDPLLFNPMVRSFYPVDKHIVNGANDLGRELEFQAAKLWAMGHEKVEAPLTIINGGDTLPFTDGAMQMLQHMIEASERGIKMPFIFIINSNNSSISTRLAGSAGDALRDSEECVRRIQDRLAHFGPAMGSGIVTSAYDVASGVQAMRDAVDTVLETGKPTYVISKFPFRPGGHASDGSPAGDDLLLSQFASFREILVRQICAAADPGTAGSELADKLDKVVSSAEMHVEDAMNGNSILNREEVERLSVPGINAIRNDPGYVIDVPSGYLLGKGVKSFAGMGADIYGKAIDSLFTEMDESGRAVRYIHQENHLPNKTDTRGGVYGELNAVQEHHLNSKFVNLLPNEAQIAQLGGGFKSTLPGDNVVLVKGPHTLFNEHAKSFLKYAAYRHCDMGEKAGFVYLMDGYNIAARDKKFVTAADGTEVERDFVIARVGEHHNSPYYSGYMADPNTTCAVPMDMNLFSSMLPEMVRLQDDGRVVPCFLPTFTFGVLHPAFSKGDLPEGRGITQNDVVRISFSGHAPKNGRDLIIVTYGPDSKWIAHALSSQGIQATMFILNYFKPPNSLISYLASHAQTGVPTEVLTVDPNPGSACMAPIMSEVRSALNYPQSMIFSDCTAMHSFVAYGYGETLLNQDDFKRTLSMRGIIDGEGFEAAPTIAAPVAATAPKATPFPVNGSAAGAEEVVTAPMEGEGVVISFRVKIGDQVNADDVVAEIESDKASVDVVAPAAGTVTEFFVDEHKEINVDMSTKICTIEVGDVATAVPEPSPTSPATAQEAAKPAEETSAESVTPLTRVELAMVDNMTVKVGDTKTFTVNENVDFSSVLDVSKAAKVSPTTSLVKLLADSVQEVSMNKKLSSDKRSMRAFSKGVDIGMAVEVDGQLRVAVVRDAGRKSLEEIGADIEAFKAKGSKLAPEDQDLDSVCFVLTSLGKNAPVQAFATLPRGISGILAIGRMQDGRSNFTFTLCHATLTGSEGARLMGEVARRAESR